MSKSGKGAPLDALDKLCMDYKSCVQCALRDNTYKGGKCEATDTKYKFSQNGSDCNLLSPGDKPNQLCKKALCECDVMFATSKFRPFNLILR